VKLGSHSTGIGGIWDSGVTPTTTNYTIATTAGSTFINTPDAAGSIFFRIAGVSAATITAALCSFPSMNTGTIQCQNINVAFGGAGGIVSTTTVPLVLSSATSLVGIGGITSSFPALKRSSTTLAVRLGDDSADAPITCAGITASGAILANAGFQTALVTKSANYTLTTSDRRVICTANSFDITLPTAVSNTNEYLIKNSGVGTITLKTTSAQTIDGSASGALTLGPGDSISVFSDNSNWLIF
jgi:hypothetical protein